MTLADLCGHGSHFDPDGPDSPGGPTGPGGSDHDNFHSDIIL